MTNLRRLPRPPRRPIEPVDEPMQVEPQPVEIGPIPMGDRDLAVIDLLLLLGVIIALTLWLMLTVALAAGLIAIPVAGWCVWRGMRA